MEKAIEFNIEKEQLKKYLEECLIEENIDYELRIEDRWIQRYRTPSEYYQVYCLYVNNNNLDKVKQFIKDFENAIIVTDDIEEFKNVEEEENNNRLQSFIHNFWKYYWGAIIIIGILIIIVIKFTT